MSDKNKDWEECMLVITYSLYLKITWLNFSKYVYTYNYNASIYICI
jgi:hypothetical protein